MKKLLISISILLLSFTFLNAQENDTEITQQQVVLQEESIQISDEDSNSTISTNQYFELELKRGIQSPLTKEIPFTLYITPKIDSSKTQILWNVPTSFTLDKNHDEFVSLNKDETYSYSVSLKPEKEGSFDIAVNVISWQFNSNKSNSVNYNISLNKSLVVQPVDTIYTIFVILIILGVLLLLALSVYIVKKSLNFFIKKIKIWLTPPF